MNEDKILTPKSSPIPRINGPKIFGVRPQSDFLYKIHATGKSPLKFEIENLPDGLKLDNSSGIITGKIDKAGEYILKLRHSCYMVLLRQQ